MARGKQSDKDRVTVSQYSGPLPPSNELGNYEEVLPGAADRILKMAEKEQQGRLDAQKTELRMLFVSHIIGRYLPFF